MPSLLWGLLLGLLATGVSACEGQSSFCEQEDDELRSSDMLNLLQTQTQLTMNGQTVNPVQQASTPSDQLDKGFVTDDDGSQGKTVDPAEGNPSTCLATCLFGFSAVMVMAAYLTKMTYPCTQASMWCVVNKIVAAFIAALFVACFRDVSEYFLTQSMFQRYFLLSPLLRFTAMLVILKILLHILSSEDSLTAAGTLGSFALGFTAIDLFDGILKLDGTEYFGVNFSQSPGSAWVGAMCCIGMMLFAMFLFTIQRGKTDPSSALHGRWQEQSEEVEDEGFAIVAGFLMSQVATYVMMAKLYPAIGMPVLVEETEVPYKSLLFAALTYTVWLIIASNIWSFKRLKVSNQSVRIEYLIVRTASMILVWSVLRWGQLVFWSSQGRWLGQRDPMLSRLAAALAFSFCSFIVVFLATDFIKESKEGGTPDFYALSSSLGLLIGQSWMTCFYRASAGFGIPVVAAEGAQKLLLHQVASHQVPAAQHEGEVWDNLFQVAIIFALLMILTPVWKAHILTKVPTKVHGAKEISTTPAIDAFIGGSRAR